MENITIIFFPVRTLRGQCGYWEGSLNPTAQPPERSRDPIWASCKRPQKQFQLSHQASIRPTTLSSPYFTLIFSHVTSRTQILGWPTALSCPDKNAAVTYCWLPALAACNQPQQSLAWLHSLPHPPPSLLYFANTRQSTSHKPTADEGGRTSLSFLSGQFETRKTFCWGPF